VQGGSELERPKLWFLMGRLVGHVAFSTGCFIALTIPAVLFSLAAHYLEGIAAVSKVVVAILEGLSYFVLSVDALTFVSYVSFSVYLVAREITGYLKGR